MKCSILESLQSSDIKRINRWLKRNPDDYEAWVKENFSTMAFAIVDVIKNVQSKGRNEILPEDLTDVEVGGDETLKTEFMKEDDVVEINYNGDKRGVDRMYRKFNDAIIGMCIFDRKTGLTPHPNKPVEGFENELNKKMFEFKESLMRDICAFTGFKFEPGYETTIDFERKINDILLSFVNKQKSGTITSATLASILYQRALDAFTILKNFDKLLKQNTPFISIKPGFENSQTKNRYQFIGANTHLDKTWTTEETVNIDDQVGDIVNVLLDYFPEYSKRGIIEGSSISKTGFYQVMMAFKEWLNKTPAADFFKDDKRSKEIREKENNILRKAAREGDEAALKKFWDLFFIIHDAETVGTNFSKNKMRGINRIFSSRLDNNFKRMFWNLAFKTEANVVETVSVNNNTVSNKRLQDNYRRTSWYHINDIITSRIRQFKYSGQDESGNKKSYKDVLYRKYGIHPDGETITLFKGKDYEMTLTKQGNAFVSQLRGERNITDAEAKKFIEEFLDDEVPDDYATIIEQLAFGGTKSSLMDLYGNVIGLIIYGVSDNNTLKWNNPNDPGRETVKLGDFRNILTRLQDFLGVANGTNVSSTLKNEAGNNVAAYTLTSMIHQLDHLILKLKDKDSSLSENPVLKQFSAYVGHPIVSGDVNIRGNKKAARALTESELAYRGIVVDFWNSINRLYADDKVQEIVYQNTVFSDKNTHFKIPYSRYFKISDKVTLGSGINGIIDGEKKSENVAAFRDAIYNYRRTSYKQILENLVTDFKTAFVDYTDEVIVNLNNAKTISQKIEAIKAVIGKYGKNAASAFKAKGVTFIPELHDRINETLFNSFDTYLTSDKTKWNKRIEAQKRIFVQDLINCGFSLNKYADVGNIQPLIDRLGKTWVDDMTGDVLLYKGDLNGEYELNPMLEAYFWSDMLLSNCYNEILFGRTFFHPAKYTPVQYNPELGESNDFDENGNKTDMYYTHMEAARLLASYKRTVIAGATFHTFLPMKYGTASEIDVAVVKDLPASVWNMLGGTDSVKALDGSGFSSPYQSYLENLSLLDAKVGWDKKTIFGDNEGRYGTPTLVKWAVYAITNNRRRMSMGSNIRLEDTFRKMHDRPIDMSKMVLSSYYNFSLDQSIPVVADLKERRTLTHEEAIYRFDERTGKHYLIADVVNNNGLVTWNEYEANPNGSLINAEPIPRSKPVETLYDLDQVFGGAYCEKINPKTNLLEYSDDNIKIVANIICHNNLKQKFIGYVINESAIKVGARNINPETALSDRNPLQTFRLSLMHGGIQMDADHLLADSDVTEMSQMISALIQNGYFTDEVNEIYETIGKIAADSLGLENRLIERDDVKAIHNLLGKNLIENFSKGDKDTIGLAQSYLMKATKILQDEGIDADIKIPFSDRSIVGAFYANLVSNINKSGIRRRYSGIADVLCPSRGMITTFNIGLGDMMWSDFVEYCRENNLNDDPLNYVRNRGDYDGNNFSNPFIKQVSNREISPQDYVILVHPDGRIEEVSVDNWTKLDNIRNRMSSDVKVYKWTCKPRELGQSDSTFTINGQTYSIYDLDSVRASHYLEEILKYYKVDKDNPLNLKLLSPEMRKKWNFIQNALRQILPVSGIVSSDRLRAIKVRLERRVTGDMKQLEGGKIESQECFANHLTRSARSWLYRPRKEVNELLPISTNPLEAYIALINKKGDYDQINQFNVPLEVKIALSYDGTNKSLEQILVDTIQLGADLNTVLNLLRSKVDIYTLTDEQEVLIVQMVDEITRLNGKMNANSSIPAHDVKTKFAQCIMGRTNAEKFGIRKGDSLYQVKKLQSKFFENRLLAQGKFPQRRVMDRSKYDAVIIGPNGEQLFIALKSKHGPEELEGFRNASDVYETRSDGNIYFKGKELCQAMNKEVYATTYPGGVSYLMLVDDLSEVEELMESDTYNTIRYNYTDNNKTELFNFQYKDSIDGETITDPIYLKRNDNSTVIINEGDKIEKITDTQIDILVENEKIKFEENVSFLAEQMWKAFEAQLYVIGARIPTQSMQSFMAMKVVGWSDSDTNEVYVPAAQTWLQGSDYQVVTSLTML